MQRIIDAVGAQGGIVAVDEAYQPVRQPHLAHPACRPSRAQRHVLLMRTLSKFGLAGARLGYMLGQPALVAEIDKVRRPTT